MKAILIALSLLGLTGCITIGDARKPIAYETIAAPKPAAERTAIVILPGFGSDTKDMKKHGVGAAIQEVWPEADVILVDATFAYYREGNLIERLHDEVIAPTLRAGYRNVWLTGASLGGMGALLYEQQHPGEMTGIVLFAPYLGDRPLLQEIDKAGGPRAWTAGEMPVEVNSENYQRQVWKMVSGWAQDPKHAPRVWLACGVEDRLFRSSLLMAKALPQNRFVELPGGHTWEAWINGGKTVFSRIRNDS